MATTTEASIINMETQILQINERSLNLCKRVIEGGGVVAFPTETVYGLGANAFDYNAVDKIFKIKGRPNDNPLIVHVHKDYDLSTLVSDIPDYSRKLAEAYLPGPLTMVYNSKGKVCENVSCGLDTLAIRIPSHEGAQRFLKYLNLPIAAPSANISKHVSPVTARHVYDDLNGKLEYILDGGKSSGGIESTVLDCTGGVPCVLRSGLITKEMIAAVVGKCDEYVYKDGERVRSPGVKYKHYSPRCRTKFYAYAERAEAFALYRESISAGIRAYLLCDDATAAQSGAENVLNLGSTEYEIADNLYEALRTGEEVADLIIGIAPEKQNGVMTGVLNRMSKACRES